jgi:hypothetical protein
MKIKKIQDWKPKHAKKGLHLVGRRYYRNCPIFGLQIILKIRRKYAVLFIYIYHKDLFNKNNLVVF